MKFIKNTPTTAQLEFEPSLLPAIQAALSYTDQQIKYSYEKLKKNVWAARSNPKYLEELEWLKNNCKKSLLKQNDQGYYTYAGVYEDLKNYLKMYNEPVEFIDTVEYPDGKLLPYDLNYKPLKPHYYQDEGAIKLIKAKHASIEFSTGAGKTLLAELLIKRLGLKTIVVAPTVSIADNLFNQFVKAFGKKYVGMFGDGKKVLNKQITVAIAASLVKVKAQEQIDELQKNLVLIYDESHLSGADTLSDVCLNLCKDIPYRFFVSATQMRTDGKDLLLNGIIGPIVYTKNYKELVKEGYLAELRIKMLCRQSLSSYNNPNNPKKSAQEHFLYNPLILKEAATIVNKCLDNGEATLVLLDEHEQVASLAPMLRHSFDIASSETDVKEVVRKFNAGESKLILGTSAVGLGTDTKPVKNLILLQFGSSEIKLRQALGRGTRIVPDKTYCNVWDFNSMGGSGPYHIKQKIQIYRSLGISFEMDK